VVLALVTCEGARHLDADLPLLEGVLPEARVVVWDDRSVDWKSFDAVFIRSAWDYHERRDEFVAWARRVGSMTRLWNPLPLIEWNTDKRYLLDLARDGVAIVPTVFVEPGRTVDGPTDLSGDLVIKPSVGAGANGAIRSTADPDRARSHIVGLHEAGLTAMVQPYSAEIDTLGETGLVYLGGEFSHAFTKSAILATPIVLEGGLYAEEHIERRTATATEIALGERVIAGLPPTAYARFDLLPSADGPLVLEVEVTEPSLYLNVDERAPERAAAVFRSLAS
jgi:glutathione synthase/RimK-type ligase-like ATP-grasp enzyme